MKIKIGLIGCLGKMGKKILGELTRSKEVKITAAVTSTNSNFIGLDIGPIIGYNSNLGIKITDSISDAFKTSDVIIDFTTKKCMLECLEKAVKYKIPLVSGTTGIENIDLRKYASKVPILWSANMSFGINVLLKLVEKASKLLNNNYDAEILEIHHNLKKDFPSGTAIELGKTIANCSKRKFCCLNSQNLHNYAKVRKKGEIGLAVSRGGGVIGDHSVMFISSDERIELNHKAINRMAFARGAIQAAIWLYKNKKGKPDLYSMQDILLL